VRLHLRMCMSIVRGVVVGMAMTVASSVHADGVAADCSQLIVGVAPDWNSMRGKLELFERSRGESWTAMAPAVPGLFSKEGLAWGSGLAGQEEPGLHKKIGRASCRERGEIYG